MFSSLGAISINYPCEYKQRVRKERFLVKHKFLRHHFKAFFRLFSIFGQKNFSCSFSTICQFSPLSSFKTLVTSNNASMIIPAAKPAFDLIHFTGPLSLSLTLGLFKESCPETNDRVYRQALSFPLTHLLFNLQRAEVILHMTYLHFPKNTVALRERNLCLESKAALKVSVTVSV